MPTGASEDVTRILGELSRGDASAAERLVPILYAELRTLASRYLSRERADHTLQPTALVHEAYLKLVDQTQARWQDRNHFLAVAATAMRRILIDHARRHGAARRSGVKVTLAEDAQSLEGPDLDFVALDQALDRLAALDERQARVTELRFFGGLDVEETAAALGVSEATVKRDWRFARAWLARELGTGP